MMESNNKAIAEIDSTWELYVVEIVSNTLDKCMRDLYMAVAEEYCIWDFLVLTSICRTCR